MVAREKFIALQKLERVQRELGSELCRALEWLNGKLHYGFERPRDRQGDLSREYAELREARLLVCHLKYPDPAETVRIRLDELAWALKLARNTCQADGQNACLALFDRAAEMLGIELAQEHSLPTDLNRKINNELQMTSGVDALTHTLVAA